MRRRPRWIPRGPVGCATAAALSPQWTSSPPGGSRSEQCPLRPYRLLLGERADEPGWPGAQVVGGEPALRPHRRIDALARLLDPDLRGGRRHHLAEDVQPAGGLGHLDLK